MSVPHVGTRVTLTAEAEHPAGDAAVAISLLEPDGTVTHFTDADEAFTAWPDGLTFTVDWLVRQEGHHWWRIEVDGQIASQASFAVAAQIVPSAFTPAP
ncbi:hypothetical protein [Miltoncostaea marina]|uniref:hypothetical protein n=1 Tax=Miltoncostaea marina TaxID=2843215 RepID=UPI001C3E14CE|nr:hypothetical protein [Miltoncostaea marina]